MDPLVAGEEENLRVLALTVISFLIRQPTCGNDKPEHDNGVEYVAHGDCLRAQSRYRLYVWFLTGPRRICRDCHWQCQRETADRIPV